MEAVMENVRGLGGRTMVEVVLLFIGAPSCVGHWDVNGWSRQA